MDQRTLAERLKVSDKIVQKYQRDTDVDLCDLIAFIRTFLQDIENWCDGYVIPDAYVIALAFIAHFDVHSPMDTRRSAVLSRRLSICLSKYVKRTYTSQFSWIVVSHREKHAANVHPLLSRLLADASDKDLWVRWQMFYQLAMAIQEWYHELHMLIGDSKETYLHTVLFYTPYHFKAFAFTFEQVHLGERFGFPIET